MTWDVPSWWAFALLALAAWRTFRLFAYDTILEPIRTRMMERYPRKGLADFMVCPFCVGFWVALVWWLVWQAWPHGTLVVATPFALSAAVGLLAANLDPD